MNLAPWLVHAEAGTEVFPSGEKIVDVTLTLSEAAAIDLETFTVEARTIVSVEPFGPLGVRLRLDPQDPAAHTLGPLPQTTPPVFGRLRSLVGLRVAKAFQTASGAVDPSDTRLAIPVTRHSWAGFSQHEYWSASGVCLDYNLFVPQAMEPGMTYPLVVFLHDRGACGPEVTTALGQGQGAVIWADPVEQAERPCFVLAPQFPRAIVNDAFQALEELAATMDLVCHLESLYPIDPRRRYGTGQSMGTMSLLEAAARDPDLFAGLLLSAGQWGPARMPALVHTPMWVVVSEDDSRAFQGMSACVDALEAAGARCVRQTWQGTWSPSEIEAAVDRAWNEPADVRFCVLEAGSLAFDDDLVVQGLPLMLRGHMQTWRWFFQVPALRRWLFDQRR